MSWSHDFAKRRHNTDCPSPGRTCRLCLSSAFGTYVIMQLKDHCLFCTCLFLLTILWRDSGADETKATIRLVPTARLRLLGNIIGSYKIQQNADWILACRFEWANREEVIAWMSCHYIRQSPMMRVCYGRDAKRRRYDKFSHWRSPWAILSFSGNPRPYILYKIQPNNKICVSAFFSREFIQTSLFCNTKHWDH